VAFVEPSCLALVHIGQDAADQRRDADDESRELENVDQLQIAFARFKKTSHVDGALCTVSHVLPFVMVLRTSP
jgi:hypothetical protein